jgi:hypothetical protein
MYELQDPRCINKRVEHAVSVKPIERKEKTIIRGQYVHGRSSICFIAVDFPPSLKPVCEARPEAVHLAATLRTHDASN